MKYFTELILLLLIFSITTNLVFYYKYHYASQYGKCFKDYSQDNIKIISG